MKHLARCISLLSALGVALIVVGNWTPAIAKPRVARAPHVTSFQSRYPLLGGVTQRPIVDKPNHTTSERPRFGRSPVLDSMVPSQGQLGVSIAYAKPTSLTPKVPIHNSRDGNIELGRSLYIANCSACHGASAEANAVGYGMRAPDLTSTPLATINAMVRVGPGQMPKFDTRTLTDAQVRDIATYVDYLRTNRPDFGGRALGDIGAAAEGAVAFVLGLGLLVIVTRFIGTNV